MKIGRIIAALFIAGVIISWSVEITSDLEVCVREKPELMFPAAVEACFNDRARRLPDLDILDDRDRSICNNISAKCW